MLKSQFKVPNRIKGHLWQKIIKRKILNEIIVLQSMSKVTRDLDIVRKNVNLYDKRHCESLAARIYFERLFGKEFVRRSATNINAALNFGYSLIRSLIARNIEIYGLEPAIGLWHCNQFNSFNLADDLIEPFRSIVDLFVSNNIQMYIKERMTLHNRVILLNILNSKVVINNKLETVTNATRLEVQSLSRCFLKRSTRLMLPKLIQNGGCK